MPSAYLKLKDNCHLTQPVKSDKGKIFQKVTISQPSKKQQFCDGNSRSILHFAYFIQTSPAERTNTPFGGERSTVPPDLIQA